MPEEYIGMNRPDAGDGPEDLRRRIRNNEYSGQTSGLAPGHVQCNLVVVPETYANDFQRFCDLNPKPCPLLARGLPGDPTLPSLGATLDVRCDLPRYRHWHHGTLILESADLHGVWSDDLVAFALGCSFSFEEALINAGIEIRHITEGVNVPMYRTTLACQSAGPFQGNMVVSMRPMSPENAQKAIEICSQYPSVHGAPIQVGNAAQLGINDLDAPDFGDRVSIASNEVAVFWACGVTPQLALERAKIPIAFTHSPGCMLITDRLNSELAVSSL